MNGLEPKQRILVALDVSTLQEALGLVSELRDHVGGFKVGLELCTSVGAPAVVEAIAAAGGSLFLDLKLKDIPNTVAGAVRSIVTNFGASVRMLTLHCDGGSAMLQAAVDAAHKASSTPPLLLGVTVMTSLDATALSQELGVPGPLQGQSVRLAHLAQTAGLDGVIASPHEVGVIKEVCGANILTVTPAVRPTWAVNGDQRRVMTPAEAIRSGADYLVIGRPIIAAPLASGGPAAAAQRIVEEISTVCA